MYSLTVPYGRTNDFFYSGHVGCCVICFLEFQSIGWNKMALFSFFNVFCQVFLMISLRGHYTIDMITGIIAGHYIWMLAEKYSYLIDVRLLRIPLKKRYHIYTKSCPNCQ